MLYVCEGKRAIGWGNKFDAGQKSLLAPVGVDVAVAHRVVVGKKREILGARSKRSKHLSKCGIGFGREISGRKISQRTVEPVARRVLSRDHALGARECEKFGLASDANNAVVARKPSRFDVD